MENKKQFIEKTSQGFHRTTCPGFLSEASGRSLASSPPFIWKEGVTCFVSSAFFQLYISWPLFWSMLQNNFPMSYNFINILTFIRVEPRLSTLGHNVHSAWKVHSGNNYLADLSSWSHCCPLQGFVVISVTPLDRPVVSSSWFLLTIMGMYKSFCMSHVFFNSDFSEVRYLEVKCTKSKRLDIFLRLSTPVIPTLCFPQGLQETQTRQRIQMMMLRILQCGHFPGGPMVKTLCLHCRECWFDSWSGN